jgi:hypothetical protein
MSGPYVRVVSVEEHNKAHRYARGRFQRRILNGYQRLSLADLMGRARRSGSGYARSLENLLVRLRKAGILVGEERADHGLRRLVIGDPAVVYRVGSFKGREFVEMPPRDSGVAVVG